MNPRVIILWPVRIGASEKIVRTSLTLKGMKSFFNEGENIKQEVSHAGKIVCFIWVHRA
jgi:hypothetical protein